MRRFVAALAASLIATGAPTPRAQQPSPPPQPSPPAAPSPDTVVARVDGEPITLGDLGEATLLLPEQLRAAPPQVLYPLLLDQLITQHALVAAARRAGLDRDPAVAARIRRAEERELQQALVGREIAGRLSEAALRERYQREIASRPPEEEIRARHILVPSEEEARAALAEARRPGADFAEIARRRSTGPGAQEGGDLGFFKRGDMIPEFAEAAFALRAGQVSETPVQSPFGWHVIKVEERRPAAPPSFEEARETLRQQMAEEEVSAVVERIRSAARIERFNLDGTPQRAAPPSSGGGSLLDNATPPPAAPQRR
ncbi:peptidylprolyl isomerase [Caldovatus aquaticus]|uniref:Parvulin-like PPIase n=1 Tax=Caldovatus aquaticus TaxID=2865671 RepID=A0ABS7F308_9PROT|nr:peptidylprolyl isomerase [Caldovatus aquaticus]MBW8269185.1 peptidylprolyl isomerase [Caldovatus aquaticus]